MFDDEIEAGAVVLFLIVMPVISVCISAGIGFLVGVWAGFFAMAAFMFVFLIFMVAGIAKSKKDGEQL